ncbi:Mss4-like protein [Tricladium varicosporioides]|nr:Mss4-like protein [Hymenoscyphus varicosporioides]
MPQGSCLCGAIEYEYKGKPIETALCHCTDCQKWSGSAYTSNVIIPSESFKLTKGTPKCYTNFGLSGKAHPHYFCGDCGSSIYVQPVAFEGLTVIKAGTLDGGAADIEISIERFIQNRNHYVAPVEGAVQAKRME